MNDQMRTWINKSEGPLCKILSNRRINDLPTKTQKNNIFQIWVGLWVFKENKTLNLVLLVSIWYCILTYSNTETNQKSFIMLYDYIIMLYDIIHLKRSNPLKYSFPNNISIKHLVNFSMTDNNGKYSNN